MWNVKVKCTSVSVLDNRGFIKGKTYTVKNGHLVFDDGSLTDGEYSNIQELNECFYATFKEVEK